MKNIVMVVLTIAMISTIAISMKSTPAIANVGAPCNSNFDCNIGAKCVMQDALGRGVCSRDALGN